VKEARAIRGQGDGGRFRPDPFEVRFLRYHNAIVVL
jgi:hypothetical protein